MTDKLLKVEKVQEEEILLMNFGEMNKRTEWVDLANLPSNDKLIGRPPTIDFLKDIQMRGVITPIILADTEKGIVVVSGTRRIKACRQLGLGGIYATIVQIPYKEAILARSAENNKRYSNDLADVDTIRTVLQDSPSCSDTRLAKMTGIPASRIKSLRGYATIDKRFIDGLQEGALAPETVLMVSKMEKRHQDRALEMMAANKAEMEKEHPGKRKGILLTKEEADTIQRSRVVENVASLNLPTINLPTMSLPIQNPLLGYVIFDTTYNIVKGFYDPADEDIAKHDCDAHILNANDGINPKSNYVVAKLVR